MEPPLEDRGPQLRDYLDVIRWRKWRIVGVTAVFLAASLWLFWRQNPRYVSQADVLLKPPTTTPRTGPINRLLPDVETELDVIGSPQVAALAKEKLNTDLSAEELASRVTATSSGGSTVLSISFSAGTASLAQEGAKAFAEAYVSYRNASARQQLESEGDRLTSQLDDLRAQLRKQNGIILSTAPDSVEFLQAQAEKRTIVTQISDVKGRILDLQNQPVTTAQGLGPASTPVWHRQYVVVPAGLFLGLLIGVILAFVAERMSDRIRSPQELQAELGASVLGTIPRLRGRSRRGRRSIATVSDSPGAVEAYRVLRTGLAFRAAQSGSKVFVVTSSGTGEGKSTTAVHLAVALAEGGRRVILVSGDVRRPAVQLFFSPGGKASPHLQMPSGWSLRQTHLRHLLLLVPNGKVRGPGWEEAEEVCRSFEALRDVADFVIVDAPPLIVADPIIMSEQADGVVFVADAKQATHASVAHARELLDQIGAEVVGVVLNRLDPAALVGGKDRYPIYGYPSQTEEDEPEATPEREVPPVRARPGSGKGRPQPRNQRIRSGAKR